MPRKSTLLVMVWLAATSLPASAQVQRAIVEAEGISAACSPGLEAALKSMDTVYQYAISVQKQMFSVTYYSGEKFDPKKLRWAADKGEAEVLRMHVSAMGKVEKDGDHQVFVSGENRFLLPDSLSVPNDVTVGIMGVVDDTGEGPMQLKPDDVKVLTDSEPAGDSAPSKE